MFCSMINVRNGPTSTERKKNVINGEKEVNCEKLPAIKVFRLPRWQPGSNRFSLGMEEPMNLIIGREYNLLVMLPKTCKSTLIS